MDGPPETGRPSFIPPALSSSDSEVVRCVWLGWRRFGSSLPRPHAPAHPSGRAGTASWGASARRLSLARHRITCSLSFLTERKEREVFTGWFLPPPLDREEEINRSPRRWSPSLSRLSLAASCVFVCVCVCVLKHVFARQALPLGVQLSFASSSRSGRVVRNSFVHSPTPPVPHDARPADPYRRLLCVNPGHDRV